jgi:hypothetical protein
MLGFSRTSPYDVCMSRNWDDFHRVKDEILARHGISKVEGIVLDKIRYRVPYPPEKLAEYIVWLTEPFPDHQFTAAQYLEAMNSLVQKNLLYILGFADAVSPAPPYSAWDDDLIDGLEGRLDFTPTGFEVMKEISDAYEKRMGRPLLRAKDSRVIE